jgi:hypothetical protein
MNTFCPKRLETHFENKVQLFIFGKRLLKKLPGMESGETVFCEGKPSAEICSETFERKCPHLGAIRPLAKNVLSRTALERGVAEGSKHVGRWKMWKSSLVRAINKTVFFLTVSEHVRNDVAMFPLNTNLSGGIHGNAVKLWCVNVLGPAPW